MRYNIGHMKRSLALVYYTEDNKYSFGLLFRYILIPFLIILLLVEPVYANSNIKGLFTAVPWDKQLHFTWGFVLVVTLVALTGSFTTGIFTVILLGLTKEYLIDDFPDMEDFIYTFCGTLLGCLITSTLIQR